MGQNWPSNGYKIPKNVPNELKFAPNMYFYEFYQIWEDFWQKFKNGQILTGKAAI